MKDLSKELLKWIVSAIVGLFLSACSGGDSGSSSGGGGASPSPVVSPGTPVSVVTLSGRSFDCFPFENRVYCKGSVFGLSSTYSLFAEGPSPFVLTAYDDTLCLTTTTGLGLRSFCFGEASWGPAYAGLPWIYTGPSFTANDIPPDVTLADLPFAGGPVTRNEIINQTYVIDGTSLVTEVTETCSDEGTKLVCPNFEVIF